MSALAKPLPWQNELWLEVTSLSLQQRLSHALLLAGPLGVGKRQFARALAAFLLCEQRSGYACGKCRSCEQMAAGHHPNFIVLQVETDDKTGKQKRDISVEQVRDFIERLQLTGHYGQFKIAMIDPADLLNASGANALLKTIEEPPGNAHILLISERAMALPATVRSRCQRLQFEPPAEDEALAWLKHEHPDVTLEGLRLAQGAPLKAARLAQDGLLARYSEWERGLTELAGQRSDPLALAASVGKEDVAQFLAWLQQWLTGLLRSALGAAPPQLAVAPAAISQLLKETLDAQRKLGSNASPQLSVEALLILWWRLSRPVKAA